MKEKEKNKVYKLILYCLISTSIIITISLSKYQSTISNENSGKVAIYAMEAYGTEESRDLKIETVGELKLEDSCSYIVTNEVDGQVTDVGVEYKIKITFEQELPEGISINVKDKDGREGAETSTGNSYIFENEEWKFTAGIVQENKITITFTGENTENATSMIMENVKVSVITEQIN